MGNIVDAFPKDISSFLSESKIVSVFYNKKIPNFFNIAQVSDLITICHLITRLRC